MKKLFTALFMLLTISVFSQSFLYTFDSIEAKTSKGNIQTETESSIIYNKDPQNEINGSLNIFTDTQNEVFFQRSPVYKDTMNDIEVINFSVYSNSDSEMYNVYIDQDRQNITISNYNNPEDYIIFYNKL